MMMSSNGSIFHVTGLLCREFGGHRWIPLPKWRWALMISLICSWTNDLVSKRGSGDLRRHHAHYDVTVMIMITSGADIITAFGFPPKVLNNVIIFNPYLLSPHQVSLLSSSPSCQAPRQMKETWSPRKPGARSRVASAWLVSSRP